MTDHVLLHNLSLIDATRDEALPDAAVWVTGTTITAAGSEADVREALGATAHRAIDMEGRFISPGLINMHTHFSLTLPGPRGAAIKGMNAHQLVLHMADGAARTLQSGVTTVRCVGERDHADFALREAINAGSVPGPRIFSAGRPVTTTGGHGHGSSGGLECDGATGFRRGVREQIKGGADFIKIMISGGISGQHEKISTRQVERAELEAAITTAHNWGKKVTAHAGPAPLIGEAVELGLDCVEHGYELTDEVTDLMAEKGCALVPTLIVTRCKPFFDELGVPEWMQKRSLGAGERHIQSFQSALKSGVTVMLGSDMPPFWKFEGTTAAVRELEHMSANGLGAKAALAAGTIVPATWLDADDRIGTITAGKFADLLATDEDPSLDTAAYRTLSWVMKGGDIARDDRALAGVDVAA